VLCSDVAHLHVDEAGAPERLLGAKLLPVPSTDGKIAPEGLRAYLAWRGDHHHPQPTVLSLTQPTEYGTVYTLAELAALREVARAHGLRIHLDGARLASAVVALDTSLPAMLHHSGADALVLGGTKGGLLFGEAVLLPAGAPRGGLALQKQTLQQAAKMRFIAAQFLALYQGSLWRDNAAHANRMAQELATLLRRYPAIQLTRPVQASAVFAVLPTAWARAVGEHFHLSPWDPLRGELRLMCSFATTTQELRELDALLARLAQPAELGAGAK
jgi:threonine aldolase